MTAPPPALLSLGETLEAIAQLAPDLIRTEPRGPLHAGYPGEGPGPDFGPLLFWDNSFSWETGMHGAIACRDLKQDVVTVFPFDVSQLLRGLMICCERRGWYWQVNPVAYQAYPYGALVSDWDRFRWKGNAPSPSHALALALLEALKAQK